MELLQTIKRFVFWDTWREKHDLKRKCLKWHISAADTHLNLGENFENWYIEIPQEQLRQDTPVWMGEQILETFFCHYTSPRGYLP